MKLFFPLEPRPKLRPRFSKHGVYTDAKTRDFEEKLRFHAFLLWRNSPIEEKIACKIRFCFQKKRNEFYHSKKPDLDNLIKALLDGLNGIVFKDDAQIWSIDAQKFYGEKPFIELELFTYHG
jgi:Holliday junction resolvase RusA-like endonuclease